MKNQLLFYFALLFFKTSQCSLIPWKLGLCVVPPIVTDLQMEKFFNGLWYEQASYGNFLFQGFGICPTKEYKIDESGQILELNYHFEQLFMKYVDVRGESYTQFIRDGQGYLPVKYSILGGLLNFDIPTYIVGTDYDNWAIIYSCKQNLFLKAEMSWIYTRDRVTEIPDEALATLKKAKLDINDYINATNIGCGPNEPQL